MPPIRRYWDSSAVIAFLRNELPAADGCALTLAAVERGEIQLVISTVTMAEVFSLRDDPRAAAEKEAIVDAFFRRRDVMPIQIDRRVAETAQALQRRHEALRRRRGLTADAIHIASAMHSGAAFLETTDGPMKDLSGQLEEAPHLVICSPGFGLQAELPLSSARGEGESRV